MHGWYFCRFAAHPREDDMPPATTTILQARHRLAAALLACAPLWPAPLSAQQACDGVAAEAVLQPVNAARARGLRCGAEGPLQTAGALEWNPLLALAAQRQADWLARHGRLVHTGPQGETLALRVAAVGYRHARISENLAAGQDGVEGAVRAWEASAAHCSNLADPRLTETALACAKGQDGQPVWVLLLGRP
jgi:uncharacterized protein YkwD